MSVVLATWENHGSRPAGAKKFVRPPSQWKKAGHGSSMAQAVEYLPSKCEALSLNPSTAHSPPQNMDSIPTCII
jgi:hypothetical protein